MNLFDFTEGKKGYYGRFGGAFIPEILHPTVKQLEDCFNEAKQDPAFWQSFVDLMQNYSGEDFVNIGVGDDISIREFAEMIAEVVAARKLETTGHEIIKTVHPHPTMSEAVMEAVAAAYGEVIHL